MQVDGLELILNKNGITLDAFFEAPSYYSHLFQIYPIVYSEYKKAYFVFNKKNAINLIRNNEIFIKKWNNKSLSSDVENKFFKNWIFYSNFNRGKKNKEILNAFFSISNINISFSSYNHNEIFKKIRYQIFKSILNIFFDIKIEEKILVYYMHADIIFKFIQSGRSDENKNIDTSIVKFNELYKEDKNFKFNKSFFETVITNTIIDGYEPLNDILWNTVYFMFLNHEVTAYKAYKLALKSNPSFRYVVRYSNINKTINKFNIKKGDKIYIFLSHFSNTGLTSLPFGYGEHLCPATNITSNFVRKYSQGIYFHLKCLGVTKMDIVRSKGMGAEGIEKLVFTLK